METLQTLLMAAPEGLIVTDKVGNVLVVNRAAERLLAVSGEIISRLGVAATLGDLVVAGPDDKPAHRAVIRRGNRVLDVHVATIPATPDAQDAEPSGTAYFLCDITGGADASLALLRDGAIDPVTHLFSAYALREALDREFHRAVRTHNRLSLVAFSIDPPSGNWAGSTGHEALLSAIGDRLRATLRKYDVASHRGDGGFLLLLPDTDSAGARAVAERVLAAVKSIDAGSAPMDICLGIANFPELPVDGPDALIELAVEALQEARQGGGHQVLVARLDAAQMSDAEIFDSDSPDAH